MPAAPLAPHLRLFAPDFARRFALITAALAAAIARIFLRNPSLVPLIIPLYRRLTRASRRCTALMTLLAAGKTPRQHHQPGRSGPRAPATRVTTTRVTTTRIPTTEAWLIETLRYEAANYASQLAHLLAEPAAAELLAAAPTTGHFLRPICRLLGLRREANPQAARRNSEAYSAGPAPPRAAPIAPEPPPRIATVLGPPPCPHVGFPWLPWPGAKRA